MTLNALASRFPSVHILLYIHVSCSYTVSYLTAEVAKTWPLEPTDSTTTEATTTIRSALIENDGV